MTDTTDAPPKVKPKGGRPRKTVTPEMVARARYLLGRMVFAARVVQQLQRKYQCSRQLGYRAVAAAQEELRAELAGQTGTDPAALAYAGLTAIAANPKATESERVRAWASIVRLLGLSRVQSAPNEEAVREFMVGVYASAAKRLGTVTQNPTPNTPENGQ